jgi:hypothetical protein
MAVQYLEIVSNDVDTLTRLYERMRGARIVICQSVARRVVALSRRALQRSGE